MVDDNGYVTRPWSEFFQALYRYDAACAASVNDGQYTLGLGSTQGKITITQGFITAVQQVVA